MGHRERLMAGAKRCLEERGYARTTSRDIAAAADDAPVGTINYHYGSKEALLNAALMELVQEWGDRTLHAAEQKATTTAERLERLWSQIAEPGDGDRPMLVATVEALAQATRSPEVRAQIADAYERGRPDMAAELHGLDAADDAETARAVGSVHMALIAGLHLQWLVDPERAPSGREVATGLRAIARGLEADG
ncbi:TetR/AcrR family transcriptional regulator [Actinomadura xylanilytica]|uniref:TetR/AcrR family transcriptional regulator n=1 Tax=Actinomadura xylanilytica TaxID=887459 RepID=UPI00255A8844|nr:TetR/AcrR family transcriptional regulator [Actinomadura xylanilytica]MDL4770672.1 TetR/AcrR family transcriptional regulator [Actinomadura xylanilytica]